MTKILIALAALCLAGCASYETTLNTWTGSSADALIASWGPPQNEAKLVDGGRVLQYASSQYGTMSMTGTLVNLNCTTNFVVGPDNIVKSWNYSGNDCR